MSLLTEAYETCVLLNKSTQIDSYGAYYTVWTDGVEFKAAITFDTSMEARIAAVQGVKDLYTVITSRALTLDYHDVFRRVSDGKVFRVTSNGADNKTPESASLDMRKVTAEEWTLNG